MAEPPTAEGAEAVDWKRRVALVVALVCLTAAAPLGGAWKVLRGTGYERRVAGLVEAGDGPRALEELERWTLLDDDAIALLDRTEGRPVVGGAIGRDARLRRAIAKIATDELGTVSRLDEEQQGWLEAAIENARRAVELQPGDASGQLLLGLLHLKRGAVLGARIDFLLAVRHLGRAASLDPDLPLVGPALLVARRQAAVE